jgi:hypothetical protein
MSEFPMFSAPDEGELLSQEDMDSLSSAQMEMLRDRCRHDLFFLSKGVLGRPDVDIYTHGPMCQFLVNEPSVRRLLLYPRGHLKSTLATVDDSIRLALKNPDNRIGIFNEIEDNAIGFLREIKAPFENNELLRFLFPELIPEKLVGPGSHWSARSAAIRRPQTYKEGTWDVFGITGSPTSRHYTNLKLDDLIGLEAKKSPAKMKEAFTFLDNIDPLLVNLDENTIDMIGTRKLRFDLYHRAKEIFGDELVIHQRQPIEHGEPIFPRKFSLKRLLHIKKSRPEFYAAEYENNPVGKGNRDFAYESIRPFAFGNNGDVVYRDDLGILRRFKVADLDLVMSADPNSGEKNAADFAAICVTGTAPNGYIFALYSWADRVSPSAFVDQCFSVYSRWRPRVIGIEQAGQQTTKHYFELKSREERLNPRVVTLKPKNRDKAARIRGALEPIISAGRLFVLKSSTTLRTQLEFHPDLENDDEIDALAYQAEEGMWRAPLGYGDDPEEKEELDDITRKIRERMYATANATTGY